MWGNRWTLWSTETKWCNPVYQDYYKFVFKHCISSISRRILFRNPLSVVLSPVRLSALVSLSPG